MKQLLLTLFSASIIASGANAQTLSNPTHLTRSNSYALRDNVIDATVTNGKQGLTSNTYTEATEAEKWTTAILYVKNNQKELAAMLDALERFPVLVDLDISGEKGVRAQNLGYVVLVLKSKKDIDS
ncbi:MAG: hypothetical protein EOO16_20865, partial [Chitinophagaceae bacterium]